MKKLFTTLTLLIALTFCVSVQAQTPQITNIGFEDWTGLGTSSEEPTDWNGFKTASGGLAGFGAQQVKRSTVVRPGTTGMYSAVIWCRDATLAMANGNLTTGQINMGSATPSSTSNYNYTKTTDAAFYEAFTGAPDSLVVWVRSNIANASHMPRIHALIHDNYSMRDPVVSGTESHIVAEATLNFTNTAGAWVRKSIPFVAGTGTTPAYALISFTTCMTPGTGTDGDSLYIDDMLFVYNPTLTTGTISASPFYITASAGAAVTIPFTLTGTMYTGNVVTAQLSDATGSFASPVVLGTLTTTTSGSISGTIPANTPSGSGYRIRVVSSNYALTAADNGSDLQINLVSSEINPATDQTYEAGLTGTAVPVTESVAATSREWKYSTTTGGPYSSFVPAEQGTSLTPSFATAGDYYVVCTSTWPGVTLTTNEVHVIVADNAITPNSTQTIDEDVNGTTMTLTETPAGVSREWKYATTSGGPYTSFVPAETNATYTPFFTDPGTYYVIGQNVVNGVTVTSPEVTIIVNLVTGINEAAQDVTIISWTEGQINIDLTQSVFERPTLILTDMNGRMVKKATLNSKVMNQVQVDLPMGIYGYTIQDQQQVVNGKIFFK